MFNPSLVSLPPGSVLAKALPLPQQSKRLLSQNLTVLSLDLLSHCIVFKDRSRRSNRCSRDNVRHYIKSFSACQPPFFNFFAFNTIPDIPSFSSVLQVNMG